MLLQQENPFPTIIKLAESPPDDNIDIRLKSGKVVVLHCFQRIVYF